MKIMGLPNWLYWTVWTLKFFILLTLTAILMVIVLQTGWYPTTRFSVFTRTDTSILFVFLMCFSCATISFCFAVSSFFTSASTAATFTGLLWFMLYVPFYFMDRFYSRYSFSEKLATCLSSNTAMAFGFRLILRHEAAGIGIQWEDVLDFQSDELILGHIMIMLLFDSALYFLISLYVGSVFPGKYGVPEKWYYPFSCSYWFGVKYVEDENHTENIMQSDHFEKEPQHLQVGVKIKHLSKQFNTNKLAVNNLSLNMYKDQISIVLGHNGAGKTTIMAMLIGMFPPTCGTATVGGCDIRSNIAGVRRSLGLCPQHNVLFDELTVSEHLYFYSRLKGSKKEEAHEQTARYVKALELVSKAHNKAYILSGGMKRKLSIALAFCGNSEVVMLDEPTAGMDPSARRLVWDLLQAEKKGRTIVLTTHFMDEADFLGDRIAIMSNGKLQCCGSSFFLKKNYGAGYHLIIDKSVACDVDEVTLLLAKYIPSIKVSSNVGSELVYILSEEFSNVFEQMLHDLESNSQSLGINTYGISLTTLEEVFLKVGTEKPVHNEDQLPINVGFKNDAYEYSDTSKNSSYVSENSVFDEEILLSGWKLRINQMKATFMKRLLSIMRGWILLAVQITIPIVFVIFIMVIILLSKGYANLPNFRVTLDYYQNPVTLLSTNKNNLYGRSYRDAFTNPNHTILEWEDADLHKKILYEMFNDPIEVNYKYIVAATMHKNQTVTSWFNNIAYHSAPLSLQLALNAILHKEVSPEYNLQFFNYPLPYSFLNTELVTLIDGKSDERTLALNISFSMAFVSSFYVLFYIKERINKVKHLQFVSGMNVMPFWVPSYVLDFVTFMLTSLGLIFTIAPFQINGFSTFEEFGRLLSFLLLFGFGMLPMMYLSTFLFDNPSTGFTKMTFFNVFTGVAAYLVIHIIKTSTLDTIQLNEALDWIFLLFPHYSLSDGIIGLTRINAINKLCHAVIQKCAGSKIPNYPNLTEKECKLIVCHIENRCCSLSIYSWTPPGILRNISILSLLGIISFVILLCVEYRIFRIPRCRILPKFPKVRRESVNIQEDHDVELERKKVEALSGNEMAKFGLIMRNVTKYYGNYAAVQDISLTVNPYECFGLLGVNGAGKTTTFKMMTGDVDITLGNAWIYGLSLESDMKEIEKLIGYCPQFDALLGELTARETLVMFGLIRGVASSKVGFIAENLAKDFDFYKHLDKKVKQMSGGNKRKLSTSLALVGNPKILYLDEPTTGMDTATKRYLWNCICKMRDSGKCIVLTSHSMEECEALCTRLAIMVNGRLMCLGSTQHLKNKFSNAYTLTIKIRRTGIDEVSTDAVEDFVRRNFENVFLRERHKELLIFSISGKYQRWSEMFGLLEGAKRHLNIEDYSLGQCSLEQVFLRLTKYQTDN